MKSKFLFLLMITAVLCQISCTCHKKSHYVMQIKTTKDSLFVDLQFDIAKENQGKHYFLFNDNIEIKQLCVNKKSTVFHRQNDTLFVDIDDDIKTLSVNYAVPLKDYTFSDATLLRRENRWYPHRKAEIFTATISLQPVDNYYVIVSGEHQNNNNYFLKPAIEIHLFLLPTEIWNRNVVQENDFAFHHYRHQQDTSVQVAAFTQEFVNSYRYFRQFFNDPESHRLFSAIEMPSSDFWLCQSMNCDCILFGKPFYDMYVQMSPNSWIPHEVAHFWWGHTLLFAEKPYRLFMEESLTEFLKLQYFQEIHGKSVSDSILAFQNVVLQRFDTSKLPSMSAIENVACQENATVVYTKMPMLLRKLELQHADFVLKTVIQKTYQKYQGTEISYSEFENELDTEEQKIIVKQLITGN